MAATVPLMSPERSLMVAIIVCSSAALTARGVLRSLNASWRHKFQSEPLIRFLDFQRSSCFSFLMSLGGSKRLFEAAINLAQFPKDQNKENRNHEQQELHVHFISSLDVKEL